MLWFLTFFLAIWLLVYHRISVALISAALVLGLIYLTSFTNVSPWILTIDWLLLVGFIICFALPPLRQNLFTKKLFTLYKRIKPNMSSTEQEALDAGTVGWEAELFRGAPRWHKLLKHNAPHLSEEEKQFLDGPVAELCSMIDDWDITHNHADLPKDIWDFLKKNGFFSLIIPKEFGGKDFSAYAHARILIAVYGRSVSVASTIAVPNSLGPAELLLKYGTDDQKHHYLPRLAKGDDIPCFALTAPDAGSDAASMSDHGIVCKGTFEGKATLGIRLTFNKRYITLAPVATVIGLAFNCYDPEQLLSEDKQPGITCALIPSTTAGVEVGRRHFPLNAVFQNGPVSGKDIFIPVDWIIGGPPMVGQGWRMLMECLAVGRGISLPSSAVGGAKVAVFATGAYARIRKQFNTSIGNFEGIQEVLARMTGLTYMIDSTLRLTVADIDEGEKPAIQSAITKYHTTEIARQIAIDAMDVHGGKGICMGPANYLARSFQATPISITVEGANILTRSMIIFGQGAIRCHPYVLEELHAADDPDPNKGLQRFDKALFAHVGFVLSNAVRALSAALTRSVFVRAPKSSVKHYYQYLSRFSSVLALLSDVSMLTLGSELKRRESLSARLGDVLSYLYMGSAVLKNYREAEEPEIDRPVVEWCMQYITHTIQRRVCGILENFPNKWIAAVCYVFCFPLGRHFKAPRDKLSHELAESIMISPNEMRDRLIKGMYLPQDKEDVLGFMEYALRTVIAAELYEKTIARAVKQGVIDGKDYPEQIAAAVAEKLISQAEAEQVLEAHHARQQVIAVDDFDSSELIHGQQQTAKKRKPKSDDSTVVKINKA